MSLPLLLIAARLPGAFGHTAATQAIALFTKDPTSLDMSYTLPGLTTSSGWDLVLYSHNKALLHAARGLPRASGTITDSLAFVEGWDDDAITQVVTLWLRLRNHTQRDMISLLSQLPNHAYSGKTELALLLHLQSLSLSHEELDRLALWHLEKGCKTTKNAKLLASIIGTAMESRTTARYLVQRLVCERQLPHAIAWLACLGKGNGFDQPLDARQDGLIGKTLRAMQSAHGRLHILTPMTKDKSLATANAKTLNAALRSLVNP